MSYEKFKEIVTNKLIDPNFEWNCHGIIQIEDYNHYLLVASLILFMAWIILFFLWKKEKLKNNE